MSRFLSVLILLNLIACSQDKGRQLLNNIDRAEDELKLEFDKANPDPKVQMDAANAYYSYILHQPNDTVRNPEFYSRAIKLYIGAEQYGQAVALVDSFISHYPDHEQVPEIYFYKGYFIYEVGFKDFNKAQKVYLEFLEKYPSHPLVEDVLMMLEHLGKEPEEILHEIRKKSQNS